MKILVCFSGGLDSAVTLALLQQENECEGLQFSYGQRHAIELDRACDLAAHYGILLHTINLPVLPKSDDVVYAGRNLLFAAHAVAFAASNGFDAVALGCNASDWERFPDCRPVFWKAVNEAASAYGIHVQMPLLRKTKADVVALAKEMRVPIAMTWSCYAPVDGEPCGECLACVTRREAGA